MSDNSLRFDIDGRSFPLDNGEVLKTLDPIQFDLAKHSFTCIVGPSGCGKTTTLRMILGLDTSYTGQIQLPQNSTVAAVFQEPRLLPWRTVEQNVRLVMPKSRQRESLDQLFSTLGLDTLNDFYPSQLSLGLARRVSLARAFVLNPDLLILDEPFVSLDARTVARLRKLLIELYESRPTTALMVTHDMIEAATLADQVLVYSQRPARIIERLKIDTPRAHRSREQIESIAKSLAQMNS